MSLEWRAALSRAYAGSTALGAESVALGNAVGRVLAGDVLALGDVPHYASSAMDGWAVSGGGPWRIVGGASLAEGEAVPIVTGGVIPEGTVGVLRSEWGTVASEELTSSAGPGEPRPGTHIRPTQTEAARGDILIAAGTRLNPAYIAVAASGGHDELTVTRRPQVAMLLTGDEVVESGLPGAGQVRDSFGVQLPALFGLLGAEVVTVTRVPDSLDATIAALSAVGGHDLIVTTGGTGHSDSDHLRAALDRLGAHLDVPALAVRPGGPSLLARLPDGPVLVGLPGNPLAAMVGIALLAAPVVAGLLGAAEPSTSDVTLGVDVAARATTVVPFQLAGPDAIPAEHARSAMMRGLAAASGLMIIPEGGARRGDRVETLPLPWVP